MATHDIPLFPLGTILFPGGLLPLQIFEVRYLDMIGRCIADGSEFGVVLLTAGSEVRTPEGEERFADVGTMAAITEWESPQPGFMRIACTGTRRFRIAASERRKNGLWMAQVELMKDDLPVPVPAELQDAARALGELLAALEQRGLPRNQMPVAAPYRLDDCGWVANRWCELLGLPAQQKQNLLALDNPLLRLELVHDALVQQGLLT